MAATDRKFRTIHLKPGERVDVALPPHIQVVDGVTNMEIVENVIVSIESQGKSAGRGNRHTVRIEAPPGSSIEIVK